MDSAYICPDCGQEYDEAGVCDSCQVELIEEGGKEDTMDSEGTFGNDNSADVPPVYGMGTQGFDDDEDHL